MTVHLLKLCVGVDSVRQLEAFQAGRRDRARARGEAPENVHLTRNAPRRAAEVLDGGSLYWVIRRRVAARQRILRLDEAVDGEGRRRCGIALDPALVRVEPRAWRPFQGWRYLEPEDAPPDLDPARAAGADSDDEMPEEMARELRALGLL